MKKVLLLLAVALPLLFAGCSKDEPESAYSDAQNKTFALFNGTWVDTQYPVHPNKITFGSHNEKPTNVYKDDYMNGKTILFENQGECTLYQWNYGTNVYEPTEFFYYVTPKADYLHLYQKTTYSLTYYSMSIKSETVINLQDRNLSYPYVFKKQ
jgi:hypothetical protein